VKEFMDIREEYHLLRKHFDKKPMLLSVRIIFLEVLLLAATPLLAAAVDNAETTDANQPTTTQTARASSDLASPRDTLKTFFLHAEQLIQDPSNRSSQIQVYRTLDIPETIGEQRTPIAVQLLGVFNHIGTINFDELVVGIEEVQEQKLICFEFFPNNPNPKAQRLFQQAIDDIGSQLSASIVFTRTDSGEWKLQYLLVVGYQYHLLLVEIIAKLWG